MKEWSQYASPRRVIPSIYTVMKWVVLDQIHANSEKSKWERLIKVAVYEVGYSLAVQYRYQGVDLSANAQV